MNMKKKLTWHQKMLIEKHNAEMKIIAGTAKSTGISQATLFYAAQLGIIGMPWVFSGKATQ